MEKESKKKSETDEPALPRRSKVGLKFAPKAPKNAPKKTIPKAESHEDSKVAVINKELLLRMRTLKSNDAHGSRAKAEKQENSIQVAFGQADPSVLRTFSSPRTFSSENPVQGAFGQAKPSVLKTFSSQRSSSSGTAAVKLPKNHDGPWDYTSINYPVSLPLGTSYSRDLDVDGDELGQSSSRAHDGEPTAAEELGLMDKVDAPQLFFQFPRSLPLQRPADSVAESDPDTNVDAKSSGKRKMNSIHGFRLREFPGGLMGKILVYKSGKVKMKLGDAHFDVSAGFNCSFAQEAVVVDTRENCSSLGEVRKRAIVTPDIDYLLGCVQME